MCRRQTIIARNDLEKRHIALEILYRIIPLRFDLRSTAPQRSAKISDLIVGLEIRANNFRTNICDRKDVYPVVFPLQMHPELC